MKSLGLIMTGACVLALPLSSFADLGPIVITPTRTEQVQNNSSATVYVLTSEQIESSGVSTTSDVLRGIPGVQVDDLYGNGSQINVMGYHDHGDAFFSLEFFHQIHHLDLVGKVQCCRGFIQKHNIRLLADGPGNENTLLFAAA